MVHVKGLALRNGWINYPTDLFLNGSNLSATFSWNASWRTLLPELTSKMALQVLQQLAEETQYGRINSDAVLSIDWEPKFRPSWNITVGEGEAHEAQPAWSALVEHVHGSQLDQGWISLVGWKRPSGDRERKWSDLSKQQQRTLEEASWNYFVREYISTAITKMKLTVSVSSAGATPALRLSPKPNPNPNPCYAVVLGRTLTNACALTPHPLLGPKKAGLQKLRVGFWDWPFKFWCVRSKSPLATDNIPP